VDEGEAEPPHDDDDDDDMRAHIGIEFAFMRGERKHGTTTTITTTAQ